MVLKNMIRFTFVLLMLSLVSLYGCNGWKDYDDTGFPDGIYDPDERPMEYARYKSYYYDEVAEQIPDYDHYVSMYTDWMNARANDLDQYQYEILPNQDYVVGKDIEPGLYYLKKTADVSWSASVWYSRRGNDELTWVDGIRYIYLLDGDRLTNPAKNNTDEKMLLAQVKNSPVMEPIDGLYFEGVYMVHEQLPPGEYFVLRTNPDTLAMVTTDIKSEYFSRFGYIRIWESETFVQTENCILMPMELKPDIRTMKIDGVDYYTEGMYKIGEDIPLGTYSIKPDLHYYTSGNYPPKAFGAPVEKNRQDVDWSLTDVYFWFGYDYYNEHLNKVYAAHMGEFNNGTIVRKSGVYCVLGHNLYDGDAVIILDVPGTYISLSHVKLLPNDTD